MNHALGQTCALLAALTWACALVLFKRSGERIPPIALNLFKNAVGSLLLVATLAVLTIAHGNFRDVLGQVCVADLCLLLLSGFIGIGLADTIFFYGLNRIGVGLMSVVDCAYAPMAILMAWLLLSETLTAYHYVGAALIVAGVFTASRHDLPVGRTRGEIAVGVFLSVLAIALMAFGIVLVKPILEDIPVVWAATLRMASGALFLALFALLGRRWKAHWTVFRPSTTWKYAVPASVLGTYLAMVFWVAGFAYTYAAVAAVLNQTSVVFQAVLAAMFLKDRFGPRRIAALILALIGVTIITLNDQLQGWARGLLAMITP